MVLKTLGIAVRMEKTLARHILFETMRRQFSMVFWHQPKLNCRRLSEARRWPNERVEKKYAEPKICFTLSKHISSLPSHPTLSYFLSYSSTFSAFSSSAFFSAFTSRSVFTSAGASAAGFSANAVSSSSERGVSTIATMSS